MLISSPTQMAITYGRDDDFRNFQLSHHVGQVYAGRQHKCHANKWGQVQREKNFRSSDPNLGTSFQPVRAL